MMQKLMMQRLHIRPFIESRPSFIGKHNRSKAKVLIFLLDRRSHRIKHYTWHELALYCGVSAVYLRNRLAKWRQWGYVTRRGCNRGEFLTWEYALGARGKHFVCDILPQDFYESCCRELNERISQLPVKLPF